MTAVQQWRKKHQNDKYRIFFADQWSAAEDAITDAMQSGFDAEDWITGVSQKAPDLFAGIALYGYSLYLSNEWQASPYDGSPEEELAALRERSVEPTLYELRHYQARFAGGTLKVIGQNVPVFIDLLYRQVEAKKAEYIELLARPIESYYSPGNDDPEFDDFERTPWNEAPFKLRDQFAGFLFGLERLRMISTSENIPELGLPNVDFFMKSTKVDTNDLLDFVESRDRELKKVQEYLAKQPIYREFGPWTNDDLAPKEFWWRHWKKRPVKKNRNK